LPTWWSRRTSFHEGNEKDRIRPMIDPTSGKTDATNAPSRKFHVRLFRPLLAGATLRERMIACLGALCCIALTGLICRLALGAHPSLPLIVAPVGASAVLLFVVPTSPMAQPWSIVGGNTISALVGVTVAHFVPDQTLALGLGVSLAIAVMSFTRCLHPPGGAAALTAIIGGPVVTSAGFLFPFVPVALNSFVLVAVGYLFHRLSRREYPHKAVRPPQNPNLTSDVDPTLRIGFRPEDIDKALEVLQESYDVSASDLEVILRQVELQAILRSHGSIRCGDVMSSDVVAVDTQDDVKLARSRLVSHGVRTLPVLGTERQLVGTVGLRELVSSSGEVGSCMSEPVTAAMDAPALALLPTLTDGRAHAVIVVDQDMKVQGLITQTDLLGAVAKLLPLAA
jgi:CBS domain-containing membrane protein